MLDLNGKSILITGGTGSFGKQFVEMALKRFPNIRRLVIYSRDEMKQFEMAQKFSVAKYPCIRYLIGDVRDRDRLIRACEDIEIIIHTAALKHVPVAEYNPMECIKTNVLGAENIIQAAMAQGVRKVVALSTDKAAAPINLYGATKLCSDKLFVAANNMKGSRDLTCSVVRYGNVIGSRGSVVPFFLNKKEEGFLPITHPEMTRFSISLEQGVDLVFYALEHAWGGEIFVPKIPSFKIIDLAEAVSPGIEKRVIGIRPGEKLHEEMITETDSLSTLEFDSHFVITPSTPIWKVDDYIAHFKGKHVSHGFKYNSFTNDVFLTIPELQDQIRLHVDPDFSVTSEQASL